MKKILLIIVTVTFFSLLYVFQQSEIFRLAYISQKHQAVLEELLDSNKLLRYNIQRSASLVHLGAKVLERSDFQLPEAYRLVRYVSLEEQPTPQGPEAAGETLLLRIFGIKRQAVAKTINP